MKYFVGMTIYKYIKIIINAGIINAYNRVGYQSVKNYAGFFDLSKMDEHRIETSATNYLTSVQPVDNFSSLRSKFKIRDRKLILLHYNNVTGKNDICGVFLEFCTNLIMRCIIKKI